MSEASIWWIIAGVLVAVELLSGTFYLLMLSLGLSAAAIASHLGVNTSVQLVIAALVGGGAVFFWYLYQKKKNRTTVESDTFSLDSNSTVYVATWQPDGCTTVRYRGAQWDACAAPGENLTAGPYQIQHIIGNRLILRRIGTS